MTAINICLLIILTVIFCIVLAKPLSILLKISVKGALYSAAVYGINLVTASIGFSVGINPVSSLLYGIFGIYGVAASYIIKLIY